MKNFLIVMIFGTMLFSFSPKIYAQCFNGSTNHTEKWYDLTGYKVLDTYIAEKKYYLEQVYGLNVELYISASQKINATARPSNTSGVDGIIVLNMGLFRGLGLDFNNLDSREYEKLNMIMAHEFTHVLQYKSNWKFTNSIYDELMADYIGGGIIGKFYVLNKNVLSLMQSFGDNEDEPYPEDDPHGYPVERYNATLFGMNSGHYFKEYACFDQIYTKPSNDDYFSIGRQLIKNGCLTVPEEQQPDCFIGALNSLGFNKPTSFTLEYASKYPYGLTFELSDGQRFKLLPGQTFTVNTQSCVNVLYIWDCPASGCHWHSHKNLIAGNAYQITDSRDNHFGIIFK